MAGIDLDGMISIAYLKKAVFTGSHKEMHFMLRKQENDDGVKIEVFAWPGPFIFSVTEDDKKICDSFEFSQEGLKSAVEWLNHRYEENFSGKM